MTQHIPHRDELVSTEELHKLTGFSKRFWEARRISGETPPFLRISSRAVRYRWGDVEQWLNTMKRNNSKRQKNHIFSRGA
jgi:predicted DNA-binding transcriptional regulator AlpA